MIKSTKSPSSCKKTIHFTFSIMPLTIHINTGRINWPQYKSIDLESKISYADFKKQYPRLFDNSRKLFVLDQKKWRLVKSQELLVSSFSYRTESYISEEERDAASLTCTQCATTFESIEDLRYHSGDLSSHEWGYNLTFSWEWSCCNLIVSTQKIQRFYAAQGCNIGKCHRCRDKKPYQRAIKQHQRELKEAGEWVLLPSSPNILLVWFSCSNKKWDSLLYGLQNISTCYDWYTTEHKNG